MAIIMIACRTGFLVASLISLTIAPIRFVKLVAIIAITLQHVVP